MYVTHAIDTFWLMLKCLIKGFGLAWVSQILDMTSGKLHPRPIAYNGVNDNIIVHLQYCKWLGNWQYSELELTGWQLGS